jgi:hypothetical protein
MGKVILIDDVMITATRNSTFICSVNEGVNNKLQIKMFRTLLYTSKVYNTKNIFIMAYNCINNAFDNNLKIMKTIKCD